MWKRATIFLLLLAPPAAAGEPPRRLGKVEDFLLEDARGARVALYRCPPGTRATVLAYTSLKCPNARLWYPRLLEIESEYRPRGVRFLAIDPDPTDSPEEIARREEKFGQRFPTLLDPLHAVTEALEVRETTEVLVLDENFRIQYRGAIDDQYDLGARKPKPHEHYLRRALDACLEVKPLQPRVTDPRGCVIGPPLGRTEPGSFTFHRDVAPILHRHCVVCHRPGQIGPMNLLDEQTARSFSAMIAEVTRTRRMPPWYASRRYGEFSNERGLTETEIALLQAWADAGAPSGDPADAPHPPAFDDEGYAIGRPDLVFALEEPIEVAATGVIPYQYRILDPGIEEDVWVQACEIRPTLPQAAHHILLAAVPKEISDEEALDKDNWKRFFEGGYFAIYVPGSRPHVYPQGMAKRLRAGTRFLAEFHFTATGEPGLDRTRVALRFATGEVEREVHTVGIFNAAFQIPPRRPMVKVHAAHSFDAPVRLLTLFPHMHLRGKSFRFEIQNPGDPMFGGKRSRVILDVPRYDPYWQEFYHLKEPLLLLPTQTLALTAVFDNSRRNPNNPDPDATVRWGWQETEEMMAGYVDYVYEDTP